MSHLTITAFNDLAILTLQRRPLSYIPILISSSSKVFLDKLLGILTHFVDYQDKICLLVITWFL